MANNRLSKILKSYKAFWDMTTWTYNEETAGPRLKLDWNRPASGLTPRLGNYDKFHRIEVTEEVA